jgi:hypothetical protein
MSATSNKKLVIVGDWVVDDYWVTGIHRSMTASRKGERQIRALHHLGSVVRSLVGAGRVATQLHHAGYQIFGVGVWHPLDTPALSDMFDSQRLEGNIPSRLCREIETKCKVEGVDLFNLANALSRGQSEPAPFGTSRVIRMFEQGERDFRLLSRVDWELPTNTEVQPPQWIGESHKTIVDGFLRQMLPSDATAVVIKDLGKGVITDTLIECLAERYPSVPWFVSTKRWNPSWLQSLAKVDVHLYLVPQIAADAAPSNLVSEDPFGLPTPESHAVYAWFTQTRRKPHPSYEAFLAVDRLKRQLSEGQQRKNLRIVVLPDRFQVLGADFSRVPRQCVIHAFPQPVAFNPHATMASNFFPTLIHRLLLDEKAELKTAVHHALSHAQRHGQFEREWLAKAADPSFRVKKEEPKLQADASDFNSSDSGFSVDASDWDLKLKEWKDAMSLKGIIDSNGTSRFEIWRAMTQVDGFVCCEQGKCAQVFRLIQAVDHFLKAAPRERTNVSVVINAEPGSGKSSLVRSLANRGDIRLLYFNLTQTRNREDIFACFETILTTQAENPRQPVLAFFDEINAQPNGQSCYDAFLSPLEDRAFFKDGRKYTLLPLMWVFAMTPEFDDHGRRRMATKQEDFESRLTVRPEIDLMTKDKSRVSNRASELVRLERIYLALAILKSKYPDVQKVSSLLLKVLHDMPDELRPRKLRDIISNCENVQYGRIGFRNIAKQDRTTICATGEPRESEGEWVVLER